MLFYRIFINEENTQSISVSLALVKLALIALQGFEEPFINAAPGAIITPAATPRCIIISHVFLIPRTFIHKKNPLCGTLKSTKSKKIYNFLLNWKKLYHNII